MRESRQRGMELTRPSLPGQKRPRLRHPQRLLHRLSTTARFNVRTACVPSPFTNDLPYMAWTRVPQLGIGVNRAFGEMFTHNQEARDRHLGWCQFAVRLAMARIHYGLLRDEPEEKWRRRLRASLRLSGIDTVIPDLPAIPHGTKEEKYDFVIDWFIVEAREYDPAPLVADLDLPTSHPTLRQYVFSPRLTPSMPDMHLSNTNNQLIYGSRASFMSRAGGLDFMQDYLLSLRSAIRNQRLPPHYVDSVLLGSQSVPPFGLLLAMTPIVRRWSRQPRSELNMATSVLLRATEARVKEQVTAIRTTAGHGTSPSSTRRPTRSSSLETTRAQPRSRRP